MRLRIFHESSRKGSVQYVILEDKPEEIFRRGSEGKGLEHLLTLLPRIKAMAKRELGDALIDVYFDEVASALMISVVPGTSIGQKRFALRALIGWIQLFDDEPRAT